MQHERGWRVLNWDDLRYFLQTIQAGSQSRAAEQLAVNRTTVGRRIAALEQALGTALLTQSGGGLQPTDAGRELLKIARQTETAIQALMACLSQDDAEPRGQLRIAAPLGLGPEFMWAFADFSQRYPGIRLELINTLNPVTSLVRRQAELGLCVIRQPPEYLDGQRLGTLERAIYASRDYIARQDRELPPEQQRWIGWGREMAHTHAARWMRAHLPADVRVGAEVNSWQALKEAVRAGLGVAQLWCFLADRDPSLVRLAPPTPELSLDLWLLHHRDLPADRNMRLLMEHLGPALSNYLNSPQPRP